ARRPVLAVEPDSRAERRASRAKGICQDRGLSGLERTRIVWCERGDSNPHGFTRQILSLVRLPIPPLSQERSSAVRLERPLHDIVPAAHFAGLVSADSGSGTVCRQGFIAAR